MKHISVLTHGLGLIALAVFSVSCINSPLLNHANASPDQYRVLYPQDAACPLHFAKENICASITWVKESTDGEKGEFTLRFWNKDSSTESGPYVEPSFDVGVKLWMPSMGHGSAPVTVKHAKDQAGQDIAGVYDVTDVYFIMPGDWEIIVQLKKNKQVIDQAIYATHI